MLELINSYIDNLKFERAPLALYEPIRYALSLGGKRIRPQLMLMSYGMYRDDIASIMPQAVGLEMYHNFTLLHDDLMDNADVRRGKPTVHRKWDANTAILSGDNMLVLAFKLMQQCPADKLPQVLATFTETALEIDEGQQYDMDFETRNDVAEEEYIEMIRLKTSVLLACALKIGALMAGAPQTDVDNLYRFGERIGLAFQLQDDYLDVYGDEAVFGKAIGGDIMCNKKTFMLINALRLAQGDDLQNLNKWISVTECDRAEKVSAVTEIYNRVGVDRLAQERMETYYEEALSALDAVNLPQDAKQPLYSFVAKMMKRNS